MSDNSNETGNGGYKSTSSLFRSLTADEVNEFRTHARENYVVGNEINEVWHPAYQFECMQMNAEAKDKIVKKWVMTQFELLEGVEDE